MRKLLFAVSTAITVSLVAPLSVTASTPEEDLKAFRNYYYERFPEVEKDDFINGVYALNADYRAQWENQEEFPAYEEDIERGEEMFNTPFANGKTYADCMKDGGIGTRHLYPYFDKDSGKIITMESEINRCRTENGEKPLKYKRGAITDLTSYIAYTSRGNVFNIEIPNDERALAAYEQGKKHYYMKRGQLNLSCADCHYYSAGMQARSETLSPSLGHLTHFPVYRLKWQSMGTPHRRFGGCNKNIRAKPYKAQSDEYKALEYYLTYLSNGLVANGPAMRK
jgi:sulfur-oxidizing protein SoxA